MGVKSDMSARETTASSTGGDGSGNNEAMGFGHSSGQSFPVEERSQLCPHMFRPVSVGLLLVMLAAFASGAIFQDEVEASNAGPVFQDQVPRVREMRLCSRIALSADTTCRAGGLCRGRAWCLRTQDRRSTSQAPEAV